MSGGPRLLAAGDAFVQSLRRGHYEIATEQPATVDGREADSAGITIDQRNKPHRPTNLGSAYVYLDDLLGSLA